MTDQPDSKVCRACGQVFERLPAPKDSAFRWMRRKFCSQECSRSMVSGKLARPQPTGKPAHV